MKRKFTFLKVLLFSFIALIFIAGCSSGGSDSSSEESAPNEEESTNEEQSSEENAGTLSGKVEVGVLPAEGTSGFQFLVDIGEEIKKDHPDAEFEFTFANTKARPFIEQRWRTGNPPDIDYFVFNGQVEKTHEFVDKLLDLTPYLEEELPGKNVKWIDTFLPSTEPIMTHDGGIYGVITDTHVIALFYNKEMFDELNLSPPETWDDFMEAGHTLKENGIDPVAVTGMFEPYMGFWVDYLFQREVGYDETMEAVHGSASFKDHPGYLRAAKKIEEMRDAGFLLNGFQGTDFTAAQIEFFQGNAGMILMGTWLSSEMKDSIPEGFQLGVTTFPSVDGGEGQQNGLLSHSNLMSVNKESENIDLAIEYIRRFTSVETQTKRAKELSLISAVKDVPAPDDIHGLDEIMANAGDLNVRYFGLEFEPDKNTDYYQEVAKFFFGDYSAEEFIDALDAAMAKYKE